MTSLFINELDQQLIHLRSQNLQRERHPMAGPQERQVTVAGRSLLNFCSNNYLGLANDARVIAAFKAGVDQWGVGAGAADLVCGHTRAHHDLELALAEFTGRPRALLFPSGYAANVGTINALLSVGDCVYQDRLNHASLLDGGWLSRADFNWFEHRDYTGLEHSLQHAERENTSRQLIVSDGVFSMDGDCCDLTQLTRLAKKYRSWLMIDDAHGLGALGNEGRGCTSVQNIAADHVHILIGTLGKAFGTSGAFVAGDEALIEVLIHKARNYIYSTAMPAAIAVATLCSLKIAREEQWRRDHLQQLVQQFQQGARQLNLPVSEPTSAIHALILGDAQRALNASQFLQQRGIWVRAIRPPTVPQNTSRLRIALSAHHQRQDVDLLLNALNEFLHSEVDG